MKRLVNLLFFPDEAGKANSSLTDAASGKKAKELYKAFVATARTHIDRMETGRFAAKVAVSLVNDGLFTLVLEDR